MKFPFFIAKRYFFSKKKSNFVHIISAVSFFGVAISTSALILGLSVFNGFENLILSMYNSFDPHLKITAVEGKVFDPRDLEKKLDHKEIKSASYILEEKVLLKYQEKEYIATVKGVDKNYLSLTSFESLLVDGEYINNYQNNNVAVVGSGVAYYLSMRLDNLFHQLQVYVPNRNSKTLLNSSSAFKQKSVLPVGIFEIQAEIDEKYIITPLSFIQNLSDREGVISAVEIQLYDARKMLDVQDYLKIELPDTFTVENRLQQQDFLYKILNTEKLAVFLILAFIMIIATFNIVGALSMLMLEKKNDIKVFRSLGGERIDVQKIFFTKSMLTIISGTATGLALGLFLAFLQQNLGLISMGDEKHFVVDSYPVVIKIADVFLVSITVIIIGTIASWYPSKVLTKKLF